MDFNQGSLVSHLTSNLVEVWCKTIDLSFFHPPTLTNKFCKNKNGIGNVDAKKLLALGPTRFCHQRLCYQLSLKPLGLELLMRDSDSPRYTTRISARSTSSRPEGLLARLLLQRFLRTQTSQSTPVVFPAQTLRRSSQI